MLDQLVFNWIATTFTARSTLIDVQCEAMSYFFDLSAFERIELTKSIAKVFDDAHGLLLDA